MNEIQQHIRAKLNDEQFAAAMHTDTSSLIIAWAWSGKTRALTYKIAYLIYGLKIKPTNILAVTFTNKAAKEMKERLMKLWDEMAELPQSATTETTNIQVESTGNDLDDFLNIMEETTVTSWVGGVVLQERDLKRIGTFHGIFLKILKEDIQKAKPQLDEVFGPNKYDQNFTILDPNDSNTIVKEVLKKLNLKEVFKPRECKSFISKQKSQGVTPKAFLQTLDGNSDYDNSMSKIYDQYQKILMISNALDFDDLLFFPYLILKKNKEILSKRQEKFQYIMVDEAQDTNWIQFELMIKLSGKRKNITLIGDDYQSIYGRRWAIMENFLNVKKYRPDIQMFKLQTNYRSRPHIVAAWSHIIKNNKNQYEKTIVAHREWNDKIIVFSHRSDMDEAANIIDFIRKMKWTKFQNRSEIAILYRTNAQSSPFEQILVQEGIPYKIRGAFKFFERKEIKDVLGYVTYLLNPHSNVSLKRIVNIPARKIWKTSVEKLENEANSRNYSLHEIIQNADKLSIKISPQAKKWLENFQSVISSVTNEFNKLTPSEVIERLVKNMNYKQYLIKEEWWEAAAEERYENIWQLINMASKYTEKGDKALRSFMEEVALLTDIAENKEWDLEAIKLMTLHSSKWLEFPLVFIVWVEDQVLPLSWSLMEPHLLEEERRLMYVGITRAENHLFLSHANSRMQRWQTKMNPPSRFIAELPEELLKRYDLWGWSFAQWGTIESPAVEDFDIEAWDTVKHKLFGTGYVVETRKNLAIVKFHNTKFGVRKVEMRFLEVK